MGKSLKDQLLSLGVTDKKNARRLLHQKKIEINEKEKSQIKYGGDPLIRESIEESLEKKKLAKQKHDRFLDQQRLAKRSAASQLAEVRDLVNHHALSRGALGERVDYRFPYGKKVRFFPVAPELKDKLGKGLLGLIELDGEIRIIPLAILDRCAERLGGSSIFIYKPKVENSEDGYPPIPEDLDW